MSASTQGRNRLGAVPSAWHAAPGVPPADLDRARAAVEASLALGKSAAHVRSPGFVQGAAERSVQNPLGVPPWARGMRPGETLGPFSDSAGLGHGVVMIPPVAGSTFSFGAAAGGFAVLPVASAAGQPPPATGHLQLGAGSVWLAAHLFSADAPADGFCGFAISGGTLTASAPLTSANGFYRVAAGTSLTLAATLAPGAGTNGGTVSGGDLAAAKIAMPDTVRIQITASAAAIEALAPASLDLYGMKLGLTWKSPAAQFSQPTQGILIPAVASVATFEFHSAISKEFVPRGTAPVGRAGWLLPVAQVPIAALGEADGAGALLLDLGPGGTFDARSCGSSRAAGWLITVNAARLIVWTGGVGGRLRTRWTLWPAVPPLVGASIAWDRPASILVSFVSTPGHELLLTAGTVTAYLDQPLAADGGAFPVSGPATLVQEFDPSGTTIAIVSSFPAAGPSSPGVIPYALALENALIGVRAPSALAIAGQTVRHAFTQAKVVLAMDALYLLPTLPDPYAANFELLDVVRDGGDQAPGALVVATAWDGDRDPEMTIALNYPAAAAGQAQPPVANAVSSVAFGDLALLDLSTRVDLFGVEVVRGSITGAGGRAGFVGLSLALPPNFVATFALPQFSWEPMRDAAGGKIVEDTTASDGVPTLVAAVPVGSDVALQRLVAVAPEPVLRRQAETVAAGGGFVAEFSLPFGLSANVRETGPTTSGKGRTFVAAGGVFALTQPHFPQQKAGGAFQLTLRPRGPDEPGAQFSGETVLFPPYATEVLGNDIAAIFTSKFQNPETGAVPIRRIDLSGYGASLFSEWSDDRAAGPSIVKVQFEAVAGRAAYEVIEAQTTLYPYGVALVRTVTIARQNSGWMRRADSGWVAAGPGVFTFPDPGFAPATFHRGAVAGVYNVRNIREFETVALDAGFSYRRVLFDADIGIDRRVRVLAGAVASAAAETDWNGQPVTLVPARDLTGYVQITPAESAKPPPPPAPMPPVTTTPKMLVALFKRVHAIIDPMACVVGIGHLGAAPGTALRCAAIEIDTFGDFGSQPAFGVALRAAPVLPRDGAWGFGRRRPLGEPAPLPLPSDFPLPVVQANADPATWHFADIADLGKLDHPVTAYGFLQDTGTQRVLFERPTIPDLTGAVPPGAIPSIQLPPGTAPALADVGALLNASGLFPDIGRAISLAIPGTVEQLRTVAEGLHYTKTLAFAGDEPPAVLLDLDKILRLDLIYADTRQGRDASNPSKWRAPTSISFNIDPAHTQPEGKNRNWWLTIGPIAFAVTVPMFGEDALLTVIGTFAADDRSTPGLTGLQIDFGHALDTLQAIFSKLQALGNFLPGGTGAGLQVTLSEGRLTVRDTFAVPTLPLGLGELSDISLDLGLAITLSPLSADFIVGLGSVGHPFNWIVSPLAGNGAIALGVQDGKPHFMIQGGIGLGLAIDLAVASGSASVTLAISVSVDTKITVLIILNGQASVDVLGGLASASLSLTAAVGISVEPLPVPIFTLPPNPGVSFPSEDITFIAQVSVGIHLSICWVVSVDFDGSWQFSQDIHTPALSVSA